MQAFVSIINLLLAHTAISFGYFNAAALLLTIALSGMLSLIFCQRFVCQIITTISGILLMASLLFLLDSKQLIYFPPILIHFFLFLFFSSSLLAGKIPRITRFATLLKGQLSTRERNYTRQATYAWSIFLFFLLCEAIILAFIAPIDIWSLFVNFINYFFVLIMFGAEFSIRRIVLKDENEGSFLHFLKSLSKIDIKQAFNKN
jgi:uncharacterized membrane protein